jgi:hypothetical protein
MSAPLLTNPPARRFLSGGGIRETALADYFAPGANVSELMNNKKVGGVSLYPPSLPYIGVTNLQKLSSFDFCNVRTPPMSGL